MQTQGQRIVAMAILFILLLDVLASPSAPRSSSPPQKSQSSLNDQDDAAEAIKLWASKSRCHTKYFQRTPDNSKDLNLSQCYKDTISELIIQHPEEYEQLGELSLFGLYGAGIQHFNCTSQTAACEHLPDCHLVAGHIADSGPEQSAEEVVERTRKILWIIEKINSWNKYFKQLETVIQDVQATVIGQGFSIVDLYTTRPDLNAEKQCEMLKRIYGWSFQFLQSVISQAWNIGTAGIFEAVKSAGMDIPSPAPMINSLLIDLPKMLAEVEQKWKEMDEQDAFNNAQTSSGGQLKMTQSYLRGLCAGFGGGMEDEQYTRSSQMQLHISQLFTTIKSRLHRLQDIVMHGNPSKGQLALFASMLDAPDLNAAVARLANNQDAFTQNMVKGIREILISESMTSSHCYVRCIEKPNVANSFCSTTGEEKDKRYCPDANTGCYTGCFTTREKGNAEVELVGLKHLKMDHLTEKEIIRISYENYKRNGNAFTHPEGFTGTEMGFDMIGKGGVSMISLPVCMSKHVDFTKSGATKPSFPAMCGDFTGNETELFHSRIGFGKDDRDVKSNMAVDLKTRIVPGVLKPLNPLTNFFGLCRNQMQFPNKYNSGPVAGEELQFLHQYKLRGASEYCDAMLAEIEQMNITKEGEANHYFCTLSRTAKEIFEDELGHVDNNGVPFEVSHYWKCQKFLEKYKVEQSKDMPW